MCEALDNRFDLIAADGFDKDHLCRLIYFLSGVKANLGVSGLRCASYSEFNGKMQVAQQRHIDEMSEPRYKMVLLALRSLCMAKVFMVSERFGFDTAWMQKPARKSKRSSAITWIQAGLD